MKAFTLTLVAALTFLATTSHAKIVTLKCGKQYDDAAVTLGNNRGVLNASNIGSYTKTSAKSLTDAVSSTN